MAGILLVASSCSELRAGGLAAPRAGAPLCVCAGVRRPGSGEGRKVPPPPHRLAGGFAQTSRASVPGGTFPGTGVQAQGTADCQAWTWCHAG